MTSTPPSRPKSLAGQLLEELLKLSTHLGETRAEMRVTNQHTDRRLTVLETKMDTTPMGRPRSRPSSPSDQDESNLSLWHRLALFNHTAETARALWGFIRLVPWGFLALMGAAAWQWIAPFVKRLLPWVAS